MLMIVRAFLSSAWRGLLPALTAACLVACGGGGGGGGAGGTTADVAPQITQQPASLSAVSGALASFTVTASGTAPLTYQWQRNTVDLAGATAATLSFAAAPIDSGAAYRVVVSNGAGSVTSGAATLTVTSTGSVGTLNGILVAAGAGAWLAGSASVPGRPVALATATQSFNIPSVPASERIVLRTSATGHLDQLKIAAVRAGAVSLVRSVLTPIGASAVLNPASGGTVQVAGSSAQLVFGANVFTRVDNGAAPSGNVTVMLTPISGGRDPDRVPGDSSTSIGGPIPFLDSLGAIGVTMVDATGQRLRVASASPATLRIPVSSRGSAALPATPALYTLDDSSARWVVTGTATLGGSGDTPYFEAPLTVAGYFNVARPIDVVYVTGCTQFGSTRTRNRSVRTEGIDDTLSGYGFTDTNGNFTVPIGKGARAVLITTGGTETTAPVIVGPSATDITLPTCLIERGSNNAVPSFVAAPASLSAQVGDTVQLHVVVDGNLPIGLQWLRNGVPMAGETGTGLTVRAGAADNGVRYSVVATNRMGTATSAAGILSVAGTGTGQACVDGLPAAGTRFVASYELKNNGVSYGSRNFDSLVGGSAVFEGITARRTDVTTSSTTTEGGNTVTQTSVSQNYIAATAVGEVTLYGGDAVSSSTSSGSTTNYTTHSLFTPAFADHIPGMKVGDVLTQSFTVRQDTTTNGVANPTLTATTTQTITFEAIESLVLPAGTFQACRFRSNTAGIIIQYWALLGLGETLKTIMGTRTQEATSVVVTP
jgi:hypothetical protein